MPVLGKRSRCPNDNGLQLPSKRATQGFVIVSDNEEDDNPFIINPRKSKRQRKTNPKYVDDDDVENSPPLVAEGKIVVSPQKAAISPNKAVASPLKGYAPTTPRHRDSAAAIARRIAITPRHRIGLLQRPQTPQSLRSPSTPRSNPLSIYNQGRKLFKSSSVQANLVIGREKERLEITSFIESRIVNKSAGCIYVSGPPGTGKSALVNQVSQQLVADHPGLVEFAYCNCMSVKSAAQAHAAILESLDIAADSTSDPTFQLKKLLLQSRRRQSYLVILDEIDNLLHLDIDGLYQLFEWSCHKSSSLILVGIANALDLTESHLPRLKSTNTRPQLVPFLPYSPDEMANIITTRLRSLLPVSHEPKDYVPLIHPTAITFLSKKVAAQTGDLRKAFAICTRALDLIESESTPTITADALPASPTKTPLRENVYLSSPASASSSPRKKAAPAPAPAVKPLDFHFKAEVAPRATIAHVARVTASVFSNGLNQRLTSLNLQQRAALCALAAMEAFLRDAATPPEQPQNDTDICITTPNKAIIKAKAKQTPTVATISKSPTMRTLYESYVRLVKRDNALAPLTATEFGDVLAGLEALGLVTCVGGGAAATPRKRGRAWGGAASSLGDAADGARVASCVGVKELQGSLKGVGCGILMGILDGQVF